MFRTTISVITAIIVMMFIDEQGSDYNDSTPPWESSSSPETHSRLSL